MLLWKGVMESPSKWFEEAHLMEEHDPSLRLGDKHLTGGWYGVLYSDNIVSFTVRSKCLKAIAVRILPFIIWISFIYSSLQLFLLFFFSEADTWRCKVSLGCQLSVAMIYGYISFYTLLFLSNTSLCLIFSPLFPVIQCITILQRSWRTTQYNRSYIVPHTLSAVSQRVGWRWQMSCSLIHTQAHTEKTSKAQSNL